MATDANRRLPARDQQKPPTPQEAWRAQMRSPRFWITLLLLVGLNIYVVNSLSAPQQPKTVNIPYSLFKQQVAADNISSITATGEQIQGDSKSSISYGGASATHFQTVKPSFEDPSLEPLLEQHKVTVNAKR